MALTAAVPGPGEGQPSQQGHHTKPTTNINIFGSTHLVFSELRFPYGTTAHSKGILRLFMDD